MMETKEVCSGRVIYDKFCHTAYCQRKVTTHEDGKPWCTIHAPSYQARKQAEREAKWDAKAAVDRKRWEEESRNKDRLALYPDLVKALKLITVTPCYNESAFHGAIAILSKAADIEKEAKG